MPYNFEPEYTEEVSRRLSKLRLRREANLNPLQVYSDAWYKSDWYGVSTPMFRSLPLQ